MSEQKHKLLEVKEMDILPQMNTVPLQMQQTSSEMVRSL